MAKFEKVLHGDLKEIDRKLSHSITANCALSNKRGSWTTEFDGGKCIFSVFEKHAKQIWNEEEQEWTRQPHGTLSLNLIDTGEEVRLCAITAGGSQDMYFNPDACGEGEMLEALKCAVEMLDEIV